MRGIGDGEKLWRVELVLRVPHHDVEQNQHRLLQAIESATAAIDGDDVPRIPDVAPTWSYDMQPPEPDRGIGVACWVLANSVGDAASTAWDAVDHATRTFAAEALLWDLRLIPREAILSSPSVGTPPTR
jgi:hypothetical protein